MTVPSKVHIRGAIKFFWANLCTNALNKVSKERCTSAIPLFGHNKSWHLRGKCNGTMHGKNGIDFYRRRQSLCPMPQIHRMVALILHAFAHTRFGREEGPIRGRLPPRSDSLSVSLTGWDIKLQSSPHIKREKSKCRRNARAGQEGRPVYDVQTMRSNHMPNFKVH